MRSKKNREYSPLINLLLYILLLIATPFLLLQNYLQTFIGKLSLYHLEIGSLHIPYIVILALAGVLIIVLLNRKQLSKFRIISILMTIFLLILGQKLSDFYFNHVFYELQHNWHYFAYGIFSYIAYRYFKAKNKSDAKIILLTFLTAICISTFDEFIQIHISNRIFDIGDIGKDTWGCVIGLFFLFFVIRQGDIIKGSRKIREKRIKSYFNNPFSILCLEAIFTLILLFISSQLTNFEYLAQSIFISIGIFIAFFLILHFSQKKTFNKIFLGMFIFYVVVQGAFFIKYHKQNIIYNSYGLTIFKGIPLPFFDVMIFENGNFRFVDKKHNFNKRDRNTIYHYSSDILLIASGEKGSGGNGFPEKQMTQFVFNTVKLKPLQVIVLKTPEACRKYNQLKKEGKNVLFIILNTR